MSKKIILCLLIVLMLFTGCGKKEVKKQEEKIVKPVIESGAVEKTFRDLFMYIPEGFNKNSYNGMGGVYNFYTGSTPGKEVDITIVVSNFEKYKDMGIKTYIETKSTPAKGIKLTETAESKINGHTWYLFNNENAYYYGTEYNDSIYEIKIEKKNNPEGKFEQANDIVKKTLYFEKNN